MKLSNNQKMVISAIGMVSIIVAALFIPSMFFNDYPSRHVNVDTHKVKNNTYDYSTIANVIILDADTVEITFNNEQKFGQFVDGVKTRSISGEFEGTRNISVGQKFITHCFENDNGYVTIDYFVLEGISMLRGIATFDHYVYETGDLDCVYPDIVLDPPLGFD